MSTPSDSFPEEESQHNNSISEEPITLDSDQRSERVREKVQPEESVSPNISSSTLPPEAEGEANGGPLGCCLGMGGKLGEMRIENMIRPLLKVGGKEGRSLDRNGEKSQSG